MKGSGGPGSSGMGSPGMGSSGANKPAVAGTSRGAAFRSPAPEKKLAAQSFVAGGAAPERNTPPAEITESDSGTWRPDNIAVATKGMDLGRVAGEFTKTESVISSEIEAVALLELEQQQKKDVALKGDATKATAKSESAVVEKAKSESVVQGADSGISDAQVAEIKAIVQDEKKFVGGLLEQSGRWQLEGAELRIFFAAEKRAFAELLEARESLEKIRNVAGKVLGRPVRVCAKIETMAAVAAAAGAGSSRGTNGGPGQNSARRPESDPDLLARFERDPMVRSMMDRFGGKISQVKPADS
jgi:hypothetical protein